MFYTARLKRMVRLMIRQVSAVDLRNDLDQPVLMTS